jgi:hypothetical protein
MTADASTDRRPPGPAPLSTTASITTFGTLGWVWIVWAVAAVVFGGILTAVAIWGEASESLWHQLGAGMQRWLFVALGFTMVGEFARMLVTNGVTRRQVARSILVTLVVLSLTGAVVALVGYLAEGLVYDRMGWTHGLGDGTALQAGELPRLFVDNVLILATYFTVGWLLGACYRWKPREEAHLLVVPCLVPALVSQVMVRGDSPVFGVVDRLYVDPPVGLGWAVTAAVLALSVVVADRLTRKFVP